ncbi:MAG: alkaline phosphatase family protein [Candidatus Nanopelagicales bacterium]
MTTAVVPPDPIARARTAAVAALTGSDLAHVVDLVAWATYDEPADGPAYADGSSPRRVTAVHVADRGGEVRLTAEHPDGTVVAGRNPLARNDIRQWAGLGEARQHPTPDHDENAYPLAWQRLSSLFRDPRAPDVVIGHTPAHYFPELGGHRGEHGSLDVLQSRAPFLLSGPGVREDGHLPGHARLVDVAPTLAWVAGVGRGALADLDGTVRDDLVERGARHVLGLLWDGAPSGALLELAHDGALPNVARLLARGCALDGGAVAEFPSLTLVNHTSALTGVGPGRHGVVGNSYRDRVLGGARSVPNDPATWHRSEQFYRDPVRTVFELVAEGVPGSRTASVNEMTERGASVSTMALVRAGIASSSARPGEPGSHESRGFRETIEAMLPDPMADATVSAAFAAEHADYRFYSAIDLLGLAQVTGLMASPDDAPLLTWWSSYVTDAAHHAGGPYSAVAEAGLRDADARLGLLLDHLQRVGLLDDTLVLLTADHGFESAREDCRGDWRPALAAALDPLGLPWVDEGPGFLYLGVAP